MTHKNLIVLLSSLSISILFIIEQILSFEYLYKTIAKVVIFFLVLFIFHYITKSKTTYFATGKTDTKRLKISAGLGIGAFLILIGAYLVLKDHIDFAQISENLAQKDITGDTFLFISLYIIFGNSFLEEIFFRGLIFKNIQQEHRLFAYIYSSFLFAIYHTAIFLTWFNIGLFMLALIGLFTIGLVFNWLNENSNNIYNSWLVHIIADSAIIIIALRAIF
ncbi:CPBP family intramembrane glutamic endopeptidase [Virgibacillus litoralis]|uniref:Membrane protease YdiL (CAAX protease family) n=1 Tax=Virgibacillus litoralis TaxID=578221 RepID=A0ABS4HIQ6_9BACI|nr:CPBP family intramembrane glutamic endopeptidase [Virgibacillus litoralis]MBP1950805.1 membrane protease YdiL (CAAX protease family) [Virgibacillus litoralis]